MRLLKQVNHKILLKQLNQTRLRSYESQLLKILTQQFKNKYKQLSSSERDIIVNDIISEKINLAKTNLWDFCELMSPDFYKDSRHHLMEISTILSFFYHQEIKIPSKIIVNGESIDIKDTEVSLLPGTVIKKLMMNIPPQHGKSRTLTNFSSWVLGQNNEERILLASYNNDSATDFSKYTRDIIKEEKNDTNDMLNIVYSDIFPNTFLKHGSSTYSQWALNGQHFNYKGGGVGGSFTSKGGTILIIDDPIKNAEEAFNESALNVVWDFLTGTFASRVSAKGGEPLEILNMTRWASKDPCGRYLDGKEVYSLKDTPFTINNKKYYFPNLYLCDKWLLLKMEVKNSNDEMLCSEIFNRNRYDHLQIHMPEEIFQANYHQKPVDVKGRLFMREDLNWFTMDQIKNTDFDEIIATGDIADEGDDNLSVPIGYKIKNDIYIVDWVFTKEATEVTEPIVAEKLYRQGVTKAIFESNNGGKGYARSVNDLLRKKLTPLRVTWKHTSSNKHTRIIMNSGNVKQNFHFRKDIKPRSEYYKAIEELLTYMKNGKVKHDDAADSITMMSEMVFGIKSKVRIW